MSYEYCEIHDSDATNGCPTCMEIDAEAEAREAVEPLVAEFAAKTYPQDSRDYLTLTELAVAAYRLAKRS
jgi:hypothetical protein